ncbi:MAG TPA: dienelactone hydrolase family protein [Longimicrobiaceae bacterium]|jgi:predicted esterase
MPDPTRDVLLLPGTGGPTLLLLHGPAGDETELVPLARALAPDATYLSPRGEVLERGIRRHFAFLHDGVADEGELARRARALRELVEGSAEGRAPGGDPVVAIGYSTGADMAAAVLLRDPGLLHAAVLLRPRWAPRARGARLDGTPVLLLAGRRDPLVPAGAAEGVARELRAAGAAVALEWTDTGHAPAQAELAVAREWMSLAGV